MNPTAPAGNGPCGKQSCSRAAQVALTFDYRDRVVWLDDLGPEADPRAALLCARCSARFTVPLGWQLLDRTSPEVDEAPVTALRSPAHPAVAARGTHGPDDLPSGIELAVPDEEHPSGPLNLRERREPPAVTLELERLARHLDTIPSPQGTPGISVRPARGHGDVASGQDVDLGHDLEEDDDDDTFGDGIDDLTEELSVIGMAEVSWPDDDTQIRPPRWADPA